MNKGGKIQIPIENTCASVRGGTFLLTYTGGDGNDFFLSEVDLEPGTRTVLSVTPPESGGATDSSGQQWFYIGIEADGDNTCSDAIKVAFIYNPA